MKKNRSLMFPFITCTWNPMGGRCPNNCIYCWSMGDKGLVKKWNMKKYQGNFRLIEKEFKRTFKEDDFVFVQDMSDLFYDTVPTRFILRVLDYIRKYPNTKFLLLTKNPKRYFRFIKDKEFPNNIVLGSTIETNINYFNILSEYKEYYDISKASYPIDRLVHMTTLKSSLPLFISIEPILDFLLHAFIRLISEIKPWAVAVGYDNYNWHLPEPRLEKVLKLIEELEKFTKVFKKTIRKAWYEK